MDDKRQYNAWYRIGNQWNPTLNVTVSQVTAHALAVMMNHENQVPYDDYRFTVSINKPMSMGFEAEPTVVEPATKKVPTKRGK